MMYFDFAISINQKEPALPLPFSDLLPVQTQTGRRNPNRRPATCFL